MNFNIGTFLLLLLLSTAVVSGCADKGSLSGLSPAQGVVTLDGAPVQDANISFSPTGGEDMRSASAQTDAQGAFTMTTLKPQDGVMPGEFIVTVVKYEQYGPAPAKVIDASGEDVTPPHPEKNILPAKYADKNNSDIKITIPASGDKNIRIELKN